MVESSPRPRYRPGSLEIEEKGLMSSPRPKMRPEESDQKEPTVADQTGLATVEARADFDPALSWNPIARLGFEGFDTDKVTDFQFTPEMIEEARRRNIDLASLSTDILDNAFYFPSRMSKEKAVKSALKEGAGETAYNIRPDDILADPGEANPSTWAHEMTHRGFDRIRESINNHPDGIEIGKEEFIKKYGQRAFDLLTKVSDEKNTEAFDFLEDKVLGTRPQEKHIQERNVSDVKEMQKTLKADPEDRWSYLEQRYEPYIKLMEAAQDILTAAGEPKKSPKYEESMFDKLKIKLGFAEGGLADQTDKMFGRYNAAPTKEQKGMGWGELIVDNILGLDNEYESFGEKLGKAINEDEIKFLKDIAVGAYEGAKEFVLSPVETTKEVVGQIKDSVYRLGAEDLNTRLQRMYNVSYDQATDEQVNQAREAVIGDALTALELIPAAKIGTTAAKAGINAIPSGIKADVVGQTKAMLSGDTEFLRGTPTERATTQSLSAGFTGQNPPTYLQRDVPLSQQEEFELDYFGQAVPTEKKNLERLELLKFREPIREFTEKLIFTSSLTNSYPKKGMLGSEFLRLLEKNAESIPPSSYKEGLIDKNKRYTKEELMDAVTKGTTSRPGDSKSAPTALYYSQARMDPSNAFSGYQRQRKHGFSGGQEMPNGYFAIPIEGTTRGIDFKANSQHFGGNTIAHVRGSIVDPMVGWNSNIYLSEDFKNLVGQKPYVLVEEIQSDLLQKGYVKPKDSFEAAFAETVKRFNTESEFTFDEAYGDITKDIKKTFKELDKLGEIEEPQRLKSVTSPDNYVFSRLKEERLIKKVKDRFWENQGEPGYVTFEELKDYIDKQGTNDQELWGFTIGLERERRLNDWFTFEFIDEKSGKTYDDFVADWDNPTFVNLLDDFTEYMKNFGLDKDSILAKYENDIDDFYDKQKSIFKKSGIDKDIPSEEFFNIYDSYKFNSRVIDPIDDIALPPIRKNKQAVEEGLKAIIAKAAKDGVTKIVIPPVEKIAEARGRTVDPTDKGDRFYRTYVTDLNQALDELSENYPVTVHRDIELPYRENRKSVDEVLNEYGVWNPDDDIVDADFADLQDMETILGDALRQQNRERFEALNINLNDPSLYVVDNPFKGTVIDISKLVEDYKVEEPRQFAEGGAVGNMNQQMSFAFEDGGLRDDGMRRDPVSGNEVPPGSTAKEVRDDIPAQLSEGEYVVPADVVRYYGVKFFEDLRNEAKIGLQDMEMNGRIGGEPVPAGGPSQDGALTPEEMAVLQELGMAEGGFVDVYAQQQNLYQPPNQAMGNFVQMARDGQVRGYAPGGLSADAQQAQNQVYAAGQQAQQAGFTGFPLGTTIFPTQAQIDQGQTTPVVPAVSQQPTSDFQPVVLINTKPPYDIITATTKDMYDQKIAEGYVLNDGSFQAQTYDDGSDYTPTPPEGEPAFKDWAKETDWNSEKGIQSFVSNVKVGDVDPLTGKLAQGAGYMLAGIPGAIAGAALTDKGFLQSVSDLRAAQIIAKANGFESLAGNIENDIDKMLEGKSGITKFLANVFATGKAKAKGAGYEEDNNGNFVKVGGGTTAPTPKSVGPKSVGPTQISGPAGTPNTPPKMRPDNNDDSPLPTSTPKSVQTAKQKTQAVTSATKGLSTEEKKGGAELDTRMGITGLNKGGLMAKGKKKK